MSALLLRGITTINKDINKTIINESNFIPVKCICNHSINMPSVSGEPNYLL